ncbi:MAG: hypothetical protein IKC35_01710 [Clostridia bacterium]|nr:hypothetical protein [Clostridia bacterium]
MKNWIRVIFALNNKFDAFSNSIDKQVDSLSSLLTVPTMKLIDSIIKLNDKKVKIINLRVLHDKMKESLTKKEYYIVMRSASGGSFAEIADIVGMSKGSTYRWYQRIMARLCKLLAYYGYDEQRFESDYKDIALVERMHKKISKLPNAS